VLPAVFDVERIELSPGDRRLVSEIRLKYGYRHAFATEDELYGSLPTVARDAINRYDFADSLTANGSFRQRIVPVMPVRVGPAQPARIRQ
jgi:hypothetical protein